MAARKNASQLPGRSTLRPTNVPSDHLLRMHQWMVRIRTAETRLWALLQESPPRFVGTLHPSRGQEAVSVASVIHTHAEDWLSPTARELGVHVFRGMPLRELFSHFANAQDGPMHGHDGGGRLGSVRLHTTPALGSTASNLAVGAGLALSFKLRKQPHVSLGYFGDGVMATGTFHEVINLVSAHRLPMVLICNNNRMGFSQLVTETSPVVDLGSRAEAYGLPHATVDGCDVEQVYDAVAKAVARARAGEGGTLLECTTVRLGGFTSEHPMLESIPKDAPDVLQRFEERLMHLELATAAQLADVHKHALAEVTDAEEHARASQVAQPGRHRTSGVLAEPVATQVAQAKSTTGAQSSGA